MPSSNSDDDASASASVVAMAAGVLGVLGVLGILLLAAGGLVVLDSSPLVDEPGANATERPETTSSESGDDPGSGSASHSDSSAGSDSGAESEGGQNQVRPFTISIERIENCGTTCRDVTASIVNNGGGPRENVVVTTELYAGSDRVWRGEQELGTFTPDETKTRTRQIDVGFVGGAKIRQNDGEVTIVTTVRWDGGSATFREQRTIS